MTNKFLRDNREIANFFLGSASDFPVYFRRGGRNTAVNFAIEIFNNFRAPLVPPDFRGGNLLAVVQNERIGNGFVSGGFGFVEVRSVWRFGIPVGPAPQGINVQQIHNSLMILLGG